MTVTRSKIAIGGAVVVVLVLFLGLTLMSQEHAERVPVTINGQTYSLRLADNFWERKQGLSGLQPDQVKADGMLFVFSKPEPRTFWMHGMHFPIDIVWLKDGKVVDIDANLPPPAPGQDPVVVSSNPLEVDQVLEFPAGFSRHIGLVPGETVKVDLP